MSGRAKCWQQSRNGPWKKILVGGLDWAKVHHNTARPQSHFSACVTASRIWKLNAWPKHGGILILDESQILEELSLLLVQLLACNHYTELPALPPSSSNQDPPHVRERMTSLKTCHRKSGVEASERGGVGLPRPFLRSGTRLRRSAAMPIPRSGFLQTSWLLAPGTTELQPRRV